MSKTIHEIINSINVDDFDVTPYTDPNVVRPLRGKQEEFLQSHHKATITFFGGSMAPSGG